MPDGRRDILRGSKNMLLKNGWKQKVIRIKPDYYEVCSFLEYYVLKIKKDSYQFFDELFNDSIDFIMQDGFKYEIKKYKPMRKNKGFLLSPDTLQKFFNCYDLISSYYDKNGITFLKSEFTELLIYLYVKRNLSDEEKSMLDADWGFEKIT